MPAAFVFQSESDDPAPTELVEVDDRLTADDALKRLAAGVRVNLEIDLIARYVERMLGGSLPRH